MANMSKAEKRCQSQNEEPQLNIAPNTEVSKLAASFQR